MLSAAHPAERRADPRLRVAVLVALAASLGGGCGDAATGPVVPLVKVPEDQRGTLALAALPEEASAPGQEEGAQREHGAKGFVSAEDIAGFEAECEKLEPAATEVAAAGRTAGYGVVYQGKGPAPDRGPVPADGTFVWVEGNAEFMDPNLISESAGTAIASQMFEPLLNTAPGNAPPVPGAASSFDLSEDGRTYTFHLRPGLTWSDGTPLTAEDFRWSWLRGLTPEIGSKNAQQLWYIDGAQAFNAGRNKDPDSVGIRVVDPLTLAVTLENPTPFFPDLVTYIAYAPVPRHVVEKYDKQWVRPEHIVVNGAYKAVEWKPRDRMILEKNPRYWDAANVAIPRTEIIFTEDESMNVRLYESGKAHWIKPLPADKVRDWITDGRSDLRIDMQMCTYYYVIRTDRPPFDDPLVRRAMNMAIDKERMTRHILAGFQVPAPNLVPDMFKDMLGYVSPKGDGFDPQRAKELLAEAGYPGGVGLPKVEIVYNTFESHRLIAEFVQRNLKENLGIDVAVNNMEWKSLLKLVSSGDFQIARTSWCADYPDPTTFLRVFDSDSENNYSSYKNPAYDDLLVRIGRETDRRKRNVLMCAAEMALNQDAPITPFYYYTRSALLRPFVRGFQSQYQDHHLIKDLRMER
ncbi:MAG: peptide ABC transporter substrate-binding protein [Deltaproteobacteria bacterium]|nr:peptide ABC transporter substrate-binding protein [Deltaproteobacteria bacterium]